MPFNFLKRSQPKTSRTAGSAAPVAGEPEAGQQPAGTHTGGARGVGFTALTEDWRLRGRMQISGRLSDALNRREAIAITDVAWAPPGAQELEPAPGLRSVDPYDLILVTAGEDSLPPLTESERLAMRVHKVAYDLALEAPPFRVIGTVFLHPGSDPDGLLARATEMFLPVVDAVAKLDDVEVSEPDVDVILVNRFYLRGVAQVDRRTGEPHPKLPGTVWTE